MISNITTKKIWLMRHGKIDFDYKNSPYNDFMDLISNGNGKDLSLAKDPEIDFKTLPKNIQLILHSPAKRADETAKIVNERLKAKSVEQLEILREVKLDRNVITREEYEKLKSLNERREPILRRWYDNNSSSEPFTESLTRVKQIEEFLHKRPEKRILIITHGWFLRLLEVYFVNQKYDNIQVEDLLKVKPIEPGCFVEAELNCQSMEAI